MAAVMRPDRPEYAAALRQVRATSRPARTRGWTRSVVPTSACRVRHDHGAPAHAARPNPARRLRRAAARPRRRRLRRTGCGRARGRVAANRARARGGHGVRHQQRVPATRRGRRAPAPRSGSMSPSTTSSRRPRPGRARSRPGCRRGAGFSRSAVPGVAEALHRTRARARARGGGGPGRRAHGIRAGRLLARPGARRRTPSARGALFVATNTDTSIPTAEGIAPGNGTLVGRGQRGDGTDADRRGEAVRPADGRVGRAGRRAAPAHRGRPARHRHRGRAPLRDRPSCSCSRVSPTSTRCSMPSPSDGRPTSRPTCAGLLAARRRSCASRPPGPATSCPGSVPCAPLSGGRATAGGRTPSAQRSAAGLSGAVRRALAR